MSEPEPVIRLDSSGRPILESEIVPKWLDFEVVRFVSLSDGGASVQVFDTASKSWVPPKLPFDYVGFLKAGAASEAKLREVGIPDDDPVFDVFKS